MNRCSVIALVCILVLTASSFTTIKPVTASGDLWVERAPMPSSEAYFGTVAVNGQIYAIGSNFTYVFDPLSDAWVSKTPMPTNQQFFAIASYQGNIYVIGGFNGTNPATGFTVNTGANEMYNPETNTWTAEAPMPNPAEGMQADVVGGNIYVISGLLGTITGPTGSPEPNISSSVWFYNPSTDSWSTATPISTPVFYYASAVVDNKIYVEGGEDSTGYTGLNQIYDPQTGTWTEGQSMPVIVHEAAAGATTGALAPAMLYIIGGTSDGFDGVNATQIYDPQANNWTLGAQMLKARLGLGVAVINDSLYAIGGISTIYSYGTTYATNEQYIPLDYQGPTPTPYLGITSPITTPSSSPTISPSTSPSPSQTPKPSPSQEPTASPKPKQSITPTELVLGSVTAVLIVIAVSTVMLKKHRRTFHQVAYQQLLNFGQKNFYFSLG
jgi:N-acetylneuraminic acid mutarotase